MKVFIRNNQKLGLGEIFKVVKEDVGSHYKVVFQGSPVKVFYNHELIHAEIPAGMLVKTTYGIGRIQDSPKSDTDGYFHYEIEFMNPRVKKNLKETVIKKIMPGVRQVKDLNPGLIIPSQFHALFITGYFLDYILPTDSRFQAICHGRIEAFPYQISVINQVLGNYPSRFLLCDEVGLGKTIEACAVLKELSLRKIVNRAIIIVPASLVLQWKFELESKFNLDFTMFDGSLIRKLKRDDANLNPWKRKRMILTSLQLARRDEHRELIKEVNFDIAIFDEAHHLRRYHNSSGSHRKTKNYELGEAVASKAGVVLLLTATPMQLNPFELFSLIKLLDPAMFPKYSDFMEFKEKISHYNFLLRNFEKFPKLNVFEKEFMINSIIELFDQESWEINENNIKNGLYRREGWLRQKLVGKITEKHLLSNILIRNKKKHAFHGKLPKRKIKIVLIEPNPEEIEVYNALRQYITHVYQRSMEEGNSAIGFVMIVFQKLLASSHYAIRATIKKRVEKLRELEVKLMKQREQLSKDPGDLDPPQLKSKLELINKKIQQIDQDVPLLSEYHEKLRSIKVDSKANAIKNLITRLNTMEKNAKIIIFTQFMRTLHYLKAFISSTIENVGIGVFHGKLSKKQKDEEVERFKKTNDKPFVFISTEAGGEGRNFQFCHIMINYDLPWNPMKLEQRIGRIDRIGQKEDVQVFNFAIKGTVEEHIVKILSERIFSFQELVGELEPILVDFDDDLENTILASGDDTDLDENFKLLDEKVYKTLEQVKDNRVAMQDIVMEIQSKNILSDETLSCSLDLNYSPILEKFILLLMDSLSGNGIDTQGGFSTIDGIEKLKKGLEYKELQDSVYLLKNGESKYAGTFDRQVALENERLDFFNLGHALIDALIELPLKTGASKFISVGHLPESMIHDGLGLNVKTKHLVGNIVFLISSVIEKTGLRNRRMLKFNFFGLRGRSKKIFHVGTVDSLKMMDVLLEKRKGSQSIKRDRKMLYNRLKSLQLHAKTLVGNLFSANEAVTEKNIESVRKEWKEENIKLRDEMIEKERYFNQYHQSTIKDKITNLTFMINEESTNLGKEDSAKVKELKASRDGLERELQEIREGYRGKIEEIHRSIDNLDITHSTLSISIIFVDK